MAKFYFLCPQCGHQVKAHDEWVGMEAECPHCGKSITIAKPEQHPASAAVEQSAGQDEKPCPFCGQMIKKEAVVCKHCKKDLTEPKKIKVTCPHCAEEVELFESQKENASCPCCGKNLDIHHVRDRAYDGQHPNQAEALGEVPAADEKPCPLCGEMINVNADFCRFCRKDISRVGTFTVKCPRCLEHLEVDYATEGKTMQCPFCGKAFKPVSDDGKRRKIAQYGLYASAAAFWSCLFSGWFGLVYALFALSVSIFALAKFSNHPNEKLKKWAVGGLVADVVAIVLASAIYMAAAGRLI